jgi:hypothetical protein
MLVIVILCNTFVPTNREKMTITKNNQLSALTSKIEVLRMPNNYNHSFEALEYSNDENLMIVSRQYKDHFEIDLNDEIYIYKTAHGCAVRVMNIINKLKLKRA